MLMLNQQQIANYLPHTAPMLLLERAQLQDNNQQLNAYSNSHRLTLHPLHNAQKRLGIYIGIEYAAQAAALHIGLTAAATPQSKPQAGFLVQAKALTASQRYLDDVQDESGHTRKAGGLTVVSSPRGCQC